MKRDTPSKVRCPRCGAHNVRCIDSRPTRKGQIRRRRRCLDCLYSFTGYEKIATANLQWAWSRANQPR